MRKEGVSRSFPFVFDFAQPYKSGCPMCCTPLSLYTYCHCEAGTPEDKTISRATPQSSRYVRYISCHMNSVPVEQTGERENGTVEGFGTDILVHNGVLYKYLVFLLWVV